MSEPEFSLTARMLDRAEEIAVVEITRPGGGRTSFFLPNEDADDLLSAINSHAGLLEACEDMLSGWRYIRQVHGDLAGVGWDRAEQAAIAAIRAAEPEKTE